VAGSWLAGDPDRGLRFSPEPAPHSSPNRARNENGETPEIPVADRGARAPGRLPDRAGRADRFEQALLAEDAATVGTFYAEDAIALPPGAPRAEGRAAIQALFASWFEQIPAPEGFTLTTNDVQLAGSGDIAYEVGTYTSRGTSPEGEAYDEAGKYLVVWKNLDGEWMIVRDAWNIDAPMHMGEGAAEATAAPEETGPEATSPAEEPPVE
jgi:uncharacterized protein (TIGR02246 family)